MIELTEDFLIGTYTNKTSKGMYRVTLDTDQERLVNVRLAVELLKPSYFRLAVTTGSTRSKRQPMARKGREFTNWEKQQLTQNYLVKPYLTAHHRRTLAWMKNATSSLGPTTTLAGLTSLRSVLMVN